MDIISCSTQMRNEVTDRAVVPLYTYMNSVFYTTIKI